MYHSDAGSEIIGLMALSLPESGGESMVASIAQVYNHFTEHRPDILRLLAEKRFRWRRYTYLSSSEIIILTWISVGIPDRGVKLIHWFANQFYLNFSTRTFIGYAEVSACKFYWPCSSNWYPGTRPWPRIPSPNTRRARSIRWFPMDRRTIQPNHQSPNRRYRMGKQSPSSTCSSWLHRIIRTSKTST